MSLTNIEYGSIASSEILNKNFNSLDEKIISSKNAIDADISSAMSNIASINLKLNDLSDEVADLNSTLSSQINEIKNKIQISLNEITLIPNWLGASTVDSLSEYSIQHNGFLYLVPRENSALIKVNDISFEITNSTFLPVKEGNVINSSSEWQSITFLPALAIVLENN